MMIDDPLGQGARRARAATSTSAGTTARRRMRTSSRWKTVYDKPLVMSEFGGDARAGRHGDADERWTEEYQENLYRHQIGDAEEASTSCAARRPGSSWTSARRAGSLPGVQDNYNRKGLVSEQGAEEEGLLRAAGLLRVAIAGATPGR